MEIKICDFCNEPYTHNTYSLNVYDNKGSVLLVGHDECTNTAHSLIKEGNNNNLNVKDTLELIGVKGK